MVHTVASSQGSWVESLDAAPGEEETDHIREDSLEILSTHFLKPKGRRLMSAHVGQ